MPTNKNFVKCRKCSALKVYKLISLHSHPCPWITNLCRSLSNHASCFAVLCSWHQYYKTQQKPIFFPLHFVRLPVMLITFTDSYLNCTKLKDKQQKDARRNWGLSVILKSSWLMHGLLFTWTAVGCARNCISRWPRSRQGAPCHWMFMSIRAHGRPRMAMLITRTPLAAGYMAVNVPQVI